MRTGSPAAAAAFVKTHSYGEFVFDFAWAQAYAQLGRRYYPKLTVAVPFTPGDRPAAAGARRTLDATALQRAAAHRARDATRRATRSRRVHALFLDEPARAACAQRAAGCCGATASSTGATAATRASRRISQTFTAEKRKKARRERRRVAEAGIASRRASAASSTSALLDRVYELHRDTFLRHGHEPYLTRAFFSEVARTLRRRADGEAGAAWAHEPVAAAIFFCGDGRAVRPLLGRGGDYHSLHFETCYHQGIEFCIEQRHRALRARHAGRAQGEPRLRADAHLVGALHRRRAISAPPSPTTWRAKAAAVDAYADEVQGHVPYRDRRAARTRL